jgi:hypothetical protein
MCFCIRTTHAECDCIVNYIAKCALSKGISVSDCPEFKILEFKQPYNGKCRREDCLGKKAPESPDLESSFQGNYFGGREEFGEAS